MCPGGYSREDGGRATDEALGLVARELKELKELTGRLDTLEHRSTAG
jgi:hypothetical protein